MPCGTVGCVFDGDGCELLFGSPFFKVERNACDCSAGKRSRNVLRRVLSADNRHIRNGSCLFAGIGKNYVESGFTCIHAKVGTGDCVFGVTVTPTSTICAEICFEVNCNVRCFRAGNISGHNYCRGSVDNCSVNAVRSSNGCAVHCNACKNIFRSVNYDCETEFRSVFTALCTESNGYVVIFCNRNGRCSTSERYKHRVFIAFVGNFGSVSFVVLQISVNLNCVANVNFRDVRRCFAGENGQLVCSVGILYVERVGRTTAVKFCDFGDNTFHIHFFGRVFVFTKGICRCKGFGNRHYIFHRRFH